MEKVIVLENVTKDYGGGRGIFDVSFSVERGEMVGLFGPSGAGKTTTFRNIMGFIKPDCGKITVFGLDSWADSEKIKKYIGYVPGEIAFPDLRTGVEFIKSRAEFLGLKDLSYANFLVDKLQLDLSASLKRMSKGMKQKTAIVAAFMASPDILILDEPTTGLDPLMRVSFLEILKGEKDKGKTILISSHSYEELEKHCDKVALIDSGRLVCVADMKKIRERPVADFKIEFVSAADYERFKGLGYDVVRDQREYCQVTISIEKAQINRLFSDLTNFNVKFIAEVKYNLERFFSENIKKESRYGQQAAF